MWNDKAPTINARQTLRALFPYFVTLASLTPTSMWRRWRWTWKPSTHRGQIYQTFNGTLLYKDLLHIVVMYLLNTIHYCVH